MARGRQQSAPEARPSRAREGRRHKRKLSPEDWDDVVAWLGWNDNATKIDGSAKAPRIGENPPTKLQGYRELASYLNSVPRNRQKQAVSGESMKDRWRYFFDKYKKLKKETLETGWGLDHPDVRAGLKTIDELKKSRFKHFFELDEIYGTSPNIVGKCYQTTHGIQIESETGGSTNDAPAAETDNLESETEHSNDTFIDRESQENESDDEDLEEDDWTGLAEMTDTPAAPVQAIEDAPSPAYRQAPPPAFRSPLESLNPNCPRAFWTPLLSVNRVQSSSIQIDAEIASWSPPHRSTPRPASPPPPSESTQGIGTHETGSRQGSVTAPENQRRRRRERSLSESARNEEGAAQTGQGENVAENNARKEPEYPAKKAVKETRHSINSSFAHSLGDLNKVRAEANKITQAMLASENQLQREKFEEEKENQVWRQKSAALDRKWLKQNANAERAERQADREERKADREERASANKRKFMVNLLQASKDRSLEELKELMNCIDKDGSTFGQ